jgi:hypothetical protein
MGVTPTKQTFRWSLLQSACISVSVQVVPAAQRAVVDSAAAPMNMDAMVMAMSIHENILLLNLSVDSTAAVNALEAAS